MKELTDKCGYLEPAKVQRANEIKNGLGKAGTLGFEKMGCYDCDGYKFLCQSYFSPKDLYERSKDGLG